MSDLVQGANGNGSFMVEVLARGETEWCGNGLRFATRAQAEDWGGCLFMRWMSVREWRVVESDQPATHTSVDGRSVPIS